MGNPDDLPIFRPKMGGGRRPSASSGATSFRNAVLASSRGAFGGRASRPTTGRLRVAIAEVTPSSRRVAVKAHYQRMTKGSAIAAAKHLRYIERDGVERDGSKGVLYSENGVCRAKDFEEPRLGEKHMFRLIVSPEDADELDLTRYVRDFMARVEVDVGRKLEWAAVNHHDTDHPHAHIVVRGVDKGGRPFRFDRAYISRGLRERAQELATRELGPRQEVDIQRARSREITQERFTSLDREIERRAPEGRLEVRRRGSGDGAHASTLVARPEHLEAMRFAERVGPASWKLEDGWQQQLRELGERGDIIKQIHKAVRGDLSRYRWVRPGEVFDGGSADDGSRFVTGRVAAKGLSDELKGGLYAVIEAPDGCAYHLPLDARSAATLRVGDVATFEKPRPPMADPEHSAVARRGGLEVRRVAMSLDVQVRHLGPVWLDGVNEGALAPYGFGAELRRALDARRAILQELGVTSEGAERIRQLRDLEMRQVAAAFEKRTGQVWQSNAPSTFRGRIEVTSSETGGASYATVSDGVRFAVVEATAAVRALNGKVATLVRDARGGFSVTPAIDKGRER